MKKDSITIPIGRELLINGQWIPLPVGYYLEAEISGKTTIYLIKGKGRYPFAMKDGWEFEVHDFALRESGLWNY